MRTHVRTHLATCSLRLPRVVGTVPPVVYLHEPDGQPLHSGGALNLTYSLLEGAEATAVRWYRDGLPLAVGGRVSVSGQSLLLRNLERGDAGNYTVEVDNNAGTGSDAVTVPVKCECLWWCSGYNSVTSVLIHSAIVAIYCIPAVPPEVALIIATPTALVTPTVNVTLVCSVVSNPQVSSVVWTSAVSGAAPSTLSESSQRSESGPYGEVMTTSRIVVFARGTEEQVCWDRGAGCVCAGCSPYPYPSPSSIHIHVQPPMPWARTRLTSQCTKEVSACADTHTHTQTQVCRLCVLM